MFANFARMWIYLVEEDLKRSGEVYDAPEVLRAVRFMRTWIGELEGAEDPAINASCSRSRRSRRRRPSCARSRTRTRTPAPACSRTATGREFDAPYQG
jgi:hypothetical protein